MMTQFNVRAHASDETLLMKKICRPLMFTVMVLCMGLAACQGDSMPASPNFDSFFSPARPVKTGLVDYGHHVLSAKYREFIATHFDYIVTGEQDLDFDFFKNLNPDIQIFAYWNSILLALDQPQPLSESAFLHDLSAPDNERDPAKRLGRIFDSDFFYVMNPGAAAWQAHAANMINAMLDNGFDGIHLDDVYAHLMHEAHFNTDEPYLIGRPDNYTTFTALPAWYDAQQSHEDYMAFISYINDHTDRKVIYNGINDVAEDLQPILESRHPKAYLQVCDGSVQEGFVYNGLWVTNPEDGFFGDEYWEAMLDILIGIPDTKVHGVVSYGDVNYPKGRLYAFASFLMGYNPDKTISYYYAPNEFTLTYLPEWSLNIGKPLATFDSVAGYRDRENDVFVREFENALVMVNPHSSATNQIAVDKGYYLLKTSQDIDILSVDGRSHVAIGEKSQLTFEPVSTVQLEAHSAVILMRKR